MDCSLQGSYPWNFSDRHSGAGCRFLLQEIFLTQGWNLPLLRLLHWHVDLLPLCRLGSSNINLTSPQVKKQNITRSLEVHLCLFQSLTSPPCNGSSFRSVQLLSCVQLFVTPWNAASQVSCPSPTPGVYSNSCPSSQ